MRPCAPRLKRPQRSVTRPTGGVGCLSVDDIRLETTEEETAAEDGSLFDNLRKFQSAGGSERILKGLRPCFCWSLFSNSSGWFILSTFTVWPPAGVIRKYFLPILLGDVRKVSSSNFDTMKRLSNLMTMSSSDLLKGNFVMNCFSRTPLRKPFCSIR